jgi:hypothetical protein
MERHARLENCTTCRPLRRSDTQGLIENKIANAPIEFESPETLRQRDDNSPARVRPDGEYREFSEDGCYVGPYFR